MEPSFFVPFFLIGGLGGFALALRKRVTKAEDELKALQERVVRLEPKPETEGSYREAPSSLPEPKPYQIQVTTVSTGRTEPRQLLDHRGGLLKCPVCDSFNASNPTYFANGCDEPMCGRQIPHLHQTCRCGASWATRAKMET